jgi:glycosyltransferase involved in cell wall biosynthesis
MTNQFVFIVPSFNNNDWYKLNIDSIINQTYNNWRVIYIDDCSTDDTLINVQQYVDSKNLNHKFTFIKNSSNIGPAGSRYAAYQQTYDDEICCMVDGDDFLYNNDVLSLINLCYEKGYNATYGCYYSLINNKIDHYLSPNKNIIPNFLISDIPYRIRHEWFSMHLRTMRSYLIKDIPLYHLKINNNWIKCCSDMSEGYYVLENIKTNILKINRPTYIYNRDNSIRYPLSYYRSDPEYQIYKNKIYDYVKGLT